MDVVRYLEQAAYLDKMIDELLLEREELLARIDSINARISEVKVKSSRTIDAAFERVIAELSEMEPEIDRCTDLYSDLKNQIADTIRTVDDREQRLILRYRYIHGFNWTQIGSELHMDRTTAKRWHDAAIENIIMPDHPIII